MSEFKIQPFMDGQRLKGLHYLVLTLCGLIMFIDGLDIFMVGKIAPAIAKDFGVKPADMTLVATVQQVGLAVGAFIATPMADRFGRKTMIVGCALIFGVLTLCAAFAQNLVQFAALRAVASVFLAGVLPMAVALLSEMTPGVRRARFIAIAMAGYSAGGAASGFIAAFLIDLYGWQSGFWVGGLLPLLCVPLMLMLLPESLQFLVGKGAPRGQIEAALRRVDPQIVLTGAETFIVGDGTKSARKAPPTDIFTEGRAYATLVLWAVCSLSMGSIALMSFWLPTFFQEMAGVPIQKYAIAAMFAFVGGLIGALSIGWLLEKFPPAKLISVFFVCLAACVVGLGFLPFSSPFFVPLLLVWHFFQTGSQAGLNTIIPKLYPASVRSTGLGWAGGIGRISGIFAQMLGGFLLTRALGLQATMMILAAIPLTVSVLILLLRTPAPVEAQPEPQPA